MKLNNIFSSNMVFAANKPIRVYGEGNNVVISLNGQTVEAVCQNGKWYAELEPMNYGGPYELTVSDCEETIVLNNVYVGDVYVCAGQSNMQFKLGESNFPKEQYSSNSALRLFSTENIRNTEYFDPTDGWIVCNKATAEHWTALGYGMGQEITADKNVAVGIITAYQGGSVIESWVPAGELEKRGVGIPESQRNADHTWEGFIMFNKEGALYEKVLKQIFPFSVTAVVWYQGESDSNLEEAAVYDKELAELIKIWRNGFCDDKLPFVVVQIADFIDCKYSGWKELQKAQENIVNLVDNVKVVISKDVCENDDIHPPTKHLLAKRIAEELIKL